MKSYPSSSALATFYAGIKNGDHPKQICRALGISKNQYKYWLAEGKKAKRKKGRGEELSSGERACLRLKKLISRAKTKYRGWS